jgi:hypothetical protein
MFGHNLHIGTPCRGKRFWTHQIPTSCLPTLLIFSRNLMGPKTLPMIWCTYMKLVTKYQISAINSYWEKCDEKWAYTCMFNVYKNQQSRQTGSRNLMGPKTLPTTWGTYMKLVTKHQISAINSCWEKCDEKCAYMFNVYKNQLLYTHWTYMHIFLSNYWWQRSDIWSQASYRYPISWEAFLDPSDSYFLFADLVGFYTHWTYMHIFRHIFLSNYWWQKSDVWSQASKYQISVINSCWEKCAYMFNVYKDQLSRQTGSRNPTGPKTLPTIWYTYMMLVTKYQISAINSYWEKCDEKYLGRTEGRTEVKQYTPPSGGGYNNISGEVSLTGGGN